MGLDNIPHVYPCEKEHGAIARTASGHIDCDVNIANERCPWKRESDRRGKPVYGMLGTYCWYRGKAGTWMLETLSRAGYDTELSFYGEFNQEDQGEQGPALSPDYCKALAEWMEDHVEAYAAAVLKEDGAEAVADAVETYRYAAWWLRFVAEFGEGSETWY